MLKFIGRILSTETVLGIVANLGNLESLKLQILIQIVRTSIPFQDTVWMSARFLFRYVIIPTCNLLLNTQVKMDSKDTT